MDKMKRLCPQCDTTELTEDGFVIHKAGCTQEAPIFDGGYQEERPQGERTLNGRIADMVKYFEYRQLPPHLREVSQRFFTLMQYALIDLPDNEEKLMAMRKLLEAKDCAVRSCL